MTDTRTLRGHAALVDRMSQALGVDLEEEVMRGQLAMDAISDAVLTCTGCSNPEACRNWLDAQDGTADQTPRYCRNADMFAELKHG